MPITDGSTPATAIETMRAVACRPCLRANSSLVTSTADAPSVSGDEVPAVTTPCSGSNTGFNDASASTVVPGRMQPSSAITSPPAVAIGTISSFSKPLARAAAAFWCDWKASSSWSARDTSYLRAMFSAVSPMLM